MSTVSENLKFLMDSKDITSKELSFKTSIKYDTITSYLKTDGPEPSASKAVLIAQALGTSVEYLVTGNDKSLPSTIKSEVIKMLKSINQLPKDDFEFVEKLIERFQR